MSKTIQNSEQHTSWLAALWQTAKATLQIDRTKLTWFQATRGEIGFILPLIIFVLTGHTLIGVVIAAGGNMLGSIGLTFPYRTRSRIMLLDCLLVALAAFVGCVAGNISWLAVLIVGLWGFIIGMFATQNSTMLILGLQTTIAIIVFSHFRAPVTNAAIYAGLIFCGAAFQTLLALLPPWKTTAPERQALANVYENLASYTSHSFDSKDGQQLRDSLVTAHTTLSQGDTQSKQGKIFVNLLNEADRININLLLIKKMRQSLHNAEEDTTVIKDHLDQLWQTYAHKFQTIASELTESEIRLSSQSHRSRRSQTSGQIDPVKKVMTTLRQYAQTSKNQADIQQLLSNLETLQDQVHNAKKLSKAWRHTPQSLPAHLRVLYPLPRQLDIQNTWANFTANLTPRSTSFRHALRIAIALALAMTIYEFLPLPLQRGYWIPLTALLVLRPDFTATFTRGIARLFGTMLGAVLTTLLVVFLSHLPAGHTLIIIIIIITSYIAFSTLAASYLIFSIAITIDIVFLLSFVEPETIETAIYRAIYTAVGGTLALLVYALWPTWEQTQLATNVAQSLNALRQYFNGVMLAYTTPDAPDRQTFDDLRKESRLTGSNTMKSIQRLQQEPRKRQVNLELAQNVIEAINNIARSVLRLDAYMLNKPHHNTFPDLNTFRQNVDEALCALENAIREKKSEVQINDLQKALDDLKHMKSTYRNRDKKIELGFIITEAEWIVRNVQAIQKLLSSRGPLIK